MPQLWLRLRSVVLLWALLAAVTLVSPATFAYDNQSTIAAKTGAPQTFEIIEGVRRAKANQLLGNQSIPAQIFNAEGKLVGQQNIAIDALRSPNKSVIDMSTQAQVDRYMSIQRGLQQGDKIPPIVVTPGGRGVPIQDIIFDATGGAR